MERMLVVVFDTETQAYEGESALREVEREGNLTVYSGAIVVKHGDGTVGVEQFNDLGPIGGLTGTAVGSLIGLLGGPAGLAIGAAGGLALGAAYDIDTARVGDDFIDDVTRMLTPNKVALVAEVDEDWTTPVDTKMETIGGSVVRRALWEVEDQVEYEHIAAMKADLAQFKAEAAKAHADRRAKLQKKVEELQTKIDAQQNQAKERHRAFEERQKAKSEILKKNAGAAGRALKTLAETRV